VLQEASRANAEFLHVKLTLSSLAYVIYGLNRARIALMVEAESTSKMRSISNGRRWGMSSSPRQSDPREYRIELNEILDNRALARPSNDIDKRNNSFDRLFLFE
jgi:hypothetical protein